ncbi:MAG: response regulator [Magnetococcales bacterium]|nr:response regulator [Magnetococcales bacterium]
MTGSPPRSSVVLVIDDDPAVLELFRVRLERLNYHVLTADGGQAGIELFDRSKPDLVLTDLRMPGVNGFEVVKHIRNTSHDTPLIVISATVEVEDVVNSLRLGAWDFLGKPLESHLILHRAIEKALERAHLLRAQHALRERLESEVVLRTRELQQANAELERLVDLYREEEEAHDRHQEALLESIARLKESQDYNRALFIASPIGLALRRLDGRMADVNPAFSALLGRSIEETEQLTIWEIISEKYIQEEQIQLQILESSGANGPYETEYIHRDGHLVLVRVSGILLELEGERFIWSSVEDITEYRRLFQKQQHRLELTEKTNVLIKSLLDPSSDDGKFNTLVQFATRTLGVDACCIWVFKPSEIREEGCIYAAEDGIRNECLRKGRCIFLKASSSLGEPFDVTHDCAPRGHDQIGLVTSQPEEWTISTNVNSDPRFQRYAWARERGLVSFVGVRLRNRKGEIVGVIANYARFVLDREQIASLFQLAALASQVIFSIQDRQQIEESLEKSQAATQAKTAFLATMSHEIRTPMNAVVGMASLLADTTLDARQRTYLEMILKGSDLLLRVINDILDFSKIEAGKMSLSLTSFDPGALLEEVAGALATAAFEKGLELYGVVEQGVPPSLLGDPVRLKQILINLVGNAIKFTSTGEVAVRVGVETREATEQGGGVEDAVRLHFSVRDTGIGVPKEQQEKIFEAFQQIEGFLTRRHGGTGLGLAICRRLADLMNGRLWLESEEGKGSCFHFACPLKVLPVQEVKEETSDIGIDLSGRRILAADQHAPSLEYLLQRLILWGAEAVGVSNIPDFRARIQEAKEAGSPFDFLLLDARLSTRDELERGEAIRPQNVDSPPLVLIFPPHRHNAFFQGDGDWKRTLFLLRPVQRGDLVRVLSGVPVVAPRSVEKPRVQRPAPDASRILVVEDNQASREMMVEMLTRAGCQAATAENGAAALDVLRRGNCHLVLMDLSMPVMDGLEATRRIRSGQEVGIDPAIPVVAMTAHVFEEERALCEEAGMSDHLSKPVNLAALMNVVARFSQERCRKAKIYTSETRQRLARRAVTLTPDPDALTLARRRTFASEGVRLFDAVKTAVESGNPDDVEQPAQALRRAAAAIGAIRLQHQALEVIRAARKLDMDALWRLLDGVREELKAVLEA